MASATQLPGPMEVSSSSNNTGGAGVYSPEKREAQFALSITLSLFLWPSLTLAVQNSWGGPASSAKREWFAQTTIDLLCAPENSDVDAEWLEEFLLNVMLDEFEVNVEDGSAFEVAEGIVKLRGQCARGDFGGVEGLGGRWEARGGNGGRIGGFRDGGEVVEEGSESELDGEDDEVDVEMDEAPQLVRVRERVEPEVDEDGFTKVMKKKR